jgi:hypothetical protein
MTEVEWLACSNAEVMVDFLRMEGKISARQFRLFAIACCRRVWHWFDNDESSRRALEVAERYADGQVTEQELWKANQAPGQSGSVTYQATNPNAGQGAFGAAASIAEGITNCFPIEEVQAAYQRESLEQSRLGRCIFANPFRPVILDPAWLTPKVKTLAQAIYNNRAFERMPELADALAEAGCSSQHILSHCRGPGPHVRGCWVVDLVWGKSDRQNHFAFRDFGFPAFARAARSFSASRQRRSRAACSDGSVIGTITNSRRVPRIAL